MGEVQAVTAEGGAKGNNNDDINNDDMNTDDDDNTNDDNKKQYQVESSCARFFLLGKKGLSQAKYILYLDTEQEST